jgi:hypothetical protein
VYKLPEMDMVQEIGGVRNYNKAVISPDGMHMVCAIDHRNSTFMWTYNPSSLTFDSEEEIPLFGNYII